jgi:hypothetical protein
MRYSIEGRVFWTWVAACIIVGALVGAGVLYLLETGTRAQVSSLEGQLATQKAAASGSAAIQAQLQSAEASVTALTTRNSQLTSEVEAARASRTKSSSGATSSVTVTVVSRSISPSTVTTSASLTMTAVVTGHPDTVQMRILGPGSTSTYRTYTLKYVSTSGTRETWRTTAPAPRKAGTYHYYAVATTGSKSVTKVGASPSVLTVK